MFSNIYMYIYICVCVCFFSLKLLHVKDMQALSCAMSLQICYLSNPCGTLILTQLFCCHLSPTQGYILSCCIRQRCCTILRALLLVDQVSVCIVQSTFCIYLAPCLLLSSATHTNDWDNHMQSTNLLNGSTQSFSVNATLISILL